MDREKVIKGLESCATDYLTQDNCKICPYGNGYDTGYCWVEMNTDALALLKEQKPIKPICLPKSVTMSLKFNFECICGSPLLEGQPFCMKCGKEQKWE